MSSPQPWPSAAPRGLRRQHSTALAAQPLQPAALVLPRAWLEAQITQAHDALAAASGGLSMWLAHGPMIIQQGWQQDLVLVGPLRQGSWRRSAPTVGVAQAPIDGAFLLALALGAEAQPPQTNAAWEQWLQSMAPTFARSHGLPDLPLAVLWLHLDGRSNRAAACLRHSVLTGEHHTPHWQALHTLHLPGAHLGRFSLGDALPTHPTPAHLPHSTTLMPQAQLPLAQHLTPSQLPSPTPSPGPDLPPQQEHAQAGTTWDDDDFITQLLAPARQDSRLAGALGLATLTQLQNAHVAVVGAGRIGSMVAHGLARMGVRHLLLIDSDVMEPHNLTGDVAPHMEGRSKVEALARFIRTGVLRPGAVVDTRQLSIDSPAVAALLDGVDWIISCVDQDKARLHANAWALAGHINYLDMATGVRHQVAEAELRLFPPGTGCLACHGGFAQHSELLRQMQHTGPQPTPDDFRLQREGSLRSWAGVAANLGLRLMEQLTAGTQRRALFRAIRETPTGGLEVHDAHPPPLVTADHHCPICKSLSGAGFAAVSSERLQHLVAQLPAPPAQASR